MRLACGLQFPASYDWECTITDALLRLFAFRFAERRGLFLKLIQDHTELRRVFWHSQGTCGLVLEQFPLDEELCPVSEAPLIRNPPIGVDRRLQ